MRCCTWRLCSNLRTLPVSRYSPRTGDVNWSGLHFSRKRVRVQAEICVGSDVKQYQRGPPVNTSATLFILPVMIDDFAI